MRKRSYKQNCALAFTSDIIGERWTMLLIRDLLIAPRRFGQLQKSLRGMGSNLLSSRLRELEAAGVLERIEYIDSQPHYQLTDAGKALEPAVLSMVRWGLKHGPRNQKDYHHQADWDLLALKALFQEELAHDLSVCVQFKTDEMTGWVAIHDRSVKIGLGTIESADVIISSSIKDLFMEPQTTQPPSRGSKKTLTRFMSAFALPT